jgi:hypothetical protein
MVYYYHEGKRNLKKESNMAKEKIKKDCSKQRTSKTYCPECGYHIRGKNHDEGDLHKQEMNKKKKE